MSKPAIRTLLVDDHAVVRSGYAHYLAQAQGFEVVGEAATADEAYSQYRQARPDIVIMDIMLPGASGIDASRRILATDPAARILIFSMYAEPTLIRQALDVGVLGALTKDSLPEILCEAAVAVARGSRYLGREIAQALAFSKYDAGINTLINLSPREFEICQMLVSGATVEEIANALSLSSKTISNRLTAIRQKLDVSTDIQLVKLAAAAGVVPWIRPSPLSS